MSFFILIHTKNDRGPAFEGPFDNDGLLTVEYQCFGNKTRVLPWGTPCQRHVVSFKNTSSLDVRNMVTDNLMFPEWTIIRQLNLAAWASAEWYSHVINHMAWPMRWGRWSNFINRFGANDSELYVHAHGTGVTYVSKLPWRFGALSGTAQRTTDLTLRMNGVISGHELSVGINQGDSAAAVTQKCFAAMQGLGMPDIGMQNGLITWERMPYPQSEFCKQFEVIDTACGLEFAIANAAELDPNANNAEHA